jgi:hypothetical protein
VVESSGFFAFFFESTLVLSLWFSWIKFGFNLTRFK